MSWVKSVKHKDMYGLKILWERVVLWYANARGENDASLLPWKRKQFRKTADGVAENYFTMADKILKDTANVTGPEIEKQKYRDNPPGKRRFKDAA
jgi:hypothetical protein